MRIIEVELYLDEFMLFPHIWKMRHTNELSAEYFGHLWAVTINWLWFQLCIYKPV